MKLIKTSFLNSIAVCIRILTLLGLNKILAIYVGPAGYAMLGQFQNFIQIVTQFASGAVNTGITKYTAEYVNDIEGQHTLWRTAGTISLICSLTTSACIIFFNKRLAIKFLGNEDYGSVFILFACTLIFFVFNAFFTAVLNGKKEISRFVMVSIAGSIFSFVLTCILVYVAGLYGCLLSMAVSSSLTFFVTLILCYKTKWFRFSYFFGAINKRELKNLAKFMVMAMSSAISIPISQLLIRNYLGSQLGWNAAGCWEAMSRISSTYLMFVTSTLGVYYLPRLSELVSRQDIREEILKGYKFILPISIVCSILIYVFRNTIVYVLLSPNFSLTIELFGWQLIGDTIKIASWLLGYIYVAKGFMRLYVFTEVVFSFMFFVLVVLLEKHFQLQAATMAYTLTYCLHFIFVYCSLKYYRVL